MSKYKCTICGYIYDEAAGIPSAGIGPGTKWAELPEGWNCPICGAPKSAFKLVPEKGVSAKPYASQGDASATEASPAENRIFRRVGGDLLRELSSLELSALCSNLAKGCEKQYLVKETGLFRQLADFFQGEAAPLEGGTASLLVQIGESLETEYPAADRAAKAAGPDRGALRVLTWSEKATRMLQSLLVRYGGGNEPLPEHTNIYVCEICGFVYIGDEPPEICPVCKVPKLKIALLTEEAAV